MSEVVARSDCRSQGCRDWVDAGRPYRDALPLAQFKATVEAHGLTVYTYPDKAHLTASKPEDHTPFSATGWPVPAPRWYGNGGDIMPRGGSWTTGGAELVRLARQIIADKDANVPGTEWVKYMNWTDEDGHCWQTGWKNGKVTLPSSDRGHIHVSGRSDMVAAVLPVYDPVARMNSTAGEDEDMGSQIGPVFLEETGYTSIMITPVEVGAANPRPAWLNLGGDTSGKDFALRVWYADDSGIFKPLGTPDGVHVVKANHRTSISLPKGTFCLSVSRVAAATPAGAVPVFTGSLSVLIEQGAVRR